VFRIKNKIHRNERNENRKRRKPNLEFTPIAITYCKWFRRCFEPKERELLTLRQAIRIAEVSALPCSQQRRISILKKSRISWGVLMFIIPTILIIIILIIFKSHKLMGLVKWQEQPSLIEPLTAEKASLRKIHPFPQVQQNASQFQLIITLISS